MPFIYPHGLVGVEQVCCIQDGGLETYIRLLCQSHDATSMMQQAFILPSCGCYLFLLKEYPVCVAWLVLMAGLNGFYIN